MINYDDLLNESGILKSIAKLEAANVKYGDSTVAQNERIKQSLIGLTGQLADFKNQIISVDNEQKGSLTTVKKQGDELVKLTNQYKAHQEVLKRNQQFLDLNSASVVAIQKRIADLRTEYDNLDRSEAKNVARQKEISKELRQSAIVLNTLTKVTRDAAKATDVAERSYDALDRQTKQLRADLRALPDAFDANTGAINRHNRVAVEMQKQIERNDKALKAADATMGQHQREVGKYSNAIKDTVGQLLGFTTVAGGIAVAFDAIKAGIAIMGDMERANQGLRAASRDTADFTRSQQYLITLADRLGVQYDTLIDNYKKLKGATRDTVLEGKETEKIFTAVTTAGAKLGLTNETIEGTLKALTDMISKGSIQAEELKGQLGDRLPGALRLLSEALGISNTKLLKMMESGQLMATDVLPKLAGKLGETYSLDQNQKIENMAAGTARLKNETALLLDTLNSDRKVTSFFGAISTGIANVLRDARLAVKDGAWKDFFLMFTPAHALSSSLRDRIGQRRATEQTMAEFGSMDKNARKKLINDLKEQELDLIKNGELSKSRQIQDLHMKLQRENIKLEVAEIQQGRREVLLKEKDAIEKNEADLERFQKQSVRKRTAEIISLEKQLASNPKDEILQKKLDVYKRLDAEQKQRDKEVKDRLKSEKPNDDNDLEKLNKQISEIEAHLQSQAMKDLKAGKAVHLDPKEVEKVRQLKEQYESLKLIMEQIENGSFGKPITGADKPLKSITEVGTGRIGKNGKVLNSEQQKDLDRKRLADETKLLDEQVGLSAEYYYKRYRLEYDFNNDLRGLGKGRKADLMELLNQLEIAEKQKDKDEVQRLKDKYGQMIEADRDYLQTKREIQQKYFEIGSALINGLFDIEQQKSANRLTQLDKERDYELSLVGDSEGAKAAIEAKYDAQRKQIQHQQDVAARNQALFNIAINTAVEVSKSLSKPGLAVAIALLGAVQAGIVLAKPLPAYEFGRDENDTYTGPAIAGEAGRELLFRDGRATLIDRPSIVNVKRKDIILPNRLTERMLSDEHAWAANSILHRTAVQEYASQIRNQNREQYQTRMMRTAIYGPSASAIGKAVGDEIAKHPKINLSWDKRGFNVSVQEANTLRKTQKDKHSLK